MNHTDPLKAAIEARIAHHEAKLADENDFNKGCSGQIINELNGILTAQSAAAKDEREPWVPYISDRADGVKGHYAICRWNPGSGGLGYREAWNLRSHCWASASDDVLTLEKAQELLRNLVIPTAQQVRQEPVKMCCYDGLTPARYCTGCDASKSTAPALSGEAEKTTSLVGNPIGIAKYRESLTKPLSSEAGQQSLTDEKIDSLMARSFPRTKPTKAYRDFARDIESAIQSPHAEAKPIHSDDMNDAVLRGIEQGIGADEYMASDVLQAEAQDVNVVIPDRFAVRHYSSSDHSTLPPVLRENEKAEAQSKITIAPCDCTPEKRRNCDYCAGYGKEGGEA